MTGPCTYGYDENNRLVSAVPPSPVPDQPAGGEYGYDWVGNRVRPPADPNPPSHTNEMVYNAVDQLTSWPGMRSYTYYPDGSLHEENAIINGQATQIGHYTYHYSGLLNEATYATPGGNHTATNTWDADGNRVQLVINGNTYKFVYDPTAGIPAVIEEQKTGGATVYYYREPNGALIARYDATNGLRYYHFDALGSTRLLTDGRTGDNLGAVTDKYSYDAWGSLIWHEKLTGSVDQPYQYVGQLGYYTHYQDPDFKLLQLGVRFYDAETGRFTQRDRIRSDESGYAYVDDNPIERMDPSGLFYCHWGWNWWSVPPIWGYHCHSGEKPGPKPTPRPKPRPIPVQPVCSIAVYMQEQCIKDVLSAAIDYERMIRNRAEKIFGNMACATLSEYLDKPWLPPGPVTKQLNELAMMMWDKCCAGKL